MWVTVGWVGIEVQIAFFIGGAYEMMPLKTWTRVCVKMDLDLDLDLGLGSDSGSRGYCIPRERWHAVIGHNWCQMIGVDARAT